MAEKTFKAFAVAPLRSLMSKRETQGIDAQEFDRPVPTVYAYPTKRYVSENLAGEQIPIETLKALAKSHADALHLGILPKGTTDYYLPSALAEGRFGSFGVNQVAVDEGIAPPKDFKVVAEARDNAVKQAYKDKKITKDEYVSFKKWGDVDPAKVPGLDKLNELFYSEDLYSSKNPSDKAQDVRNASFKLGFPTYSTDIMRTGSGYSKQDIYHPDQSALGETALALYPESLAKNAAMKTLALINKQKETNITDPLELWTAFNGLGVRKDETGKVIASPEIYKAKLTEIKNMLEDPANAPLKTTYDGLVNAYLTGKLK